MKLRDYQTDMLAQGMKHIRSKRSKAQVYAPTGAGKTVVFVAIIKKLLKKNPALKILVVHPRLALSTDQQVRFTKELPTVGLTSFHSGAVVQSGRKRINIATTDISKLQEVLATASDGHVVFTSYHSAERIVQLFDVIIFDEAHYLVQTEFTQIVRKLNDAQKVFFFTATPVTRAFGFSMDDEKDFGPVIAKVLPKTLIARGYMAQPKLFKATVTTRGKTGIPDPITTIGHVFKDQAERVREMSDGKIVPKLLVAMSSTTQFHRIMGDRAQIQAIAGIELDLFYVTAGTQHMNGKVVKSRQEALNLFAASEKPSIIVHCDTLAEGIDIHGITGVFPFRDLSKPKFLQTIGRAARPSLLDLDKNGEPIDLENRLKPNFFVTILTDAFGQMIGNARSWIEALQGGDYGDLETLVADQSDYVWGKDAHEDYLRSADPLTKMDIIQSIAFEEEKLNLLRFINA